MKDLKKYISQFFTLLFVLFLGFTVKADGIGITVNGNKSNLESKAFIINDRTYVPMRDLFESIGASVSWNDESKSATAAFNNSTVSFKIDSNYVTKNGEYYWSDSQCKLVDGKTYVPVRIILELLGFNVIWDEEDKNVNISTLPSYVPETDIPQDSENSNTPSETANNEYELRVLELINNERTKHGLSQLSIDMNLSIVARAHSTDMHRRNFFNHINPDGLSPFDRIKNYGISYRYAAENIAAGQTTPEEVVNSWMSSDGHRKNILNENFKKIGVGYYNSNDGYFHYWTQCFTD